MQQPENSPWSLGGFFEDIGEGIVGIGSKYLDIELENRRMQTASPENNAQHNPVRGQNSDGSTIVAQPQPQGMNISPTAMMLGGLGVVLIVVLAVRS